MILIRQSNEDLRKRINELIVVEPTTGKNRSVLIKLYGVDLAHMAREPSNGRSSSYIPKEHRPVSARRGKFDVIMCTIKLKTYNHQNCLC